MLRTNSEHYGSLKKNTQQQRRISFTWCERQDRRSGSTSHPALRGLLIRLRLNAAAAPYTPKERK